MRSPPARLAASLCILTVLACLGGCTRRHPLAQGGLWEVEFHQKWSWKEWKWDWLGVQLYRRLDSGRELVGHDVTGYEFLEDDCILYFETAPPAIGYFIACGHREPLLVSTRYYGWRLTDQAFVLYEEENGKKVVRDQRPIQDLLQLARRQPSGVGGAQQ